MQVNLYQTLLQAQQFVLQELEEDESKNQNTARYGEQYPDDWPLPNGTISETLKVASFGNARTAFHRERDHRGEPSRTKQREMLNSYANNLTKGGNHATNRHAPNTSISGLVDAVSLDGQNGARGRSQLIGQPMAQLSIDNPQTELRAAPLSFPMRGGLGTAPSTFALREGNSIHWLIGKVISYTSHAT
jgi:hypothetical protein